ncbi:efflux RND transporter periplasmic adaptor subunit [Allorhodopirellula solitaria]|uniref:Multidrug resistance protein MdtA n=1 Tax=Allorhodopirellula solitaria TaxID=2527987 RepID=A0A5C5X0P2_9BACT|nr:efflux RND transporter periplasmic adaptor subunit [Allorhodopirellula solitaria]TWT56169.1 Multidrug resistance protein MdtA precursor [Allorhodopirellula solitaria]
MTDLPPPKRWRWLGVLATIVVCVCIFSAAAAAIVVINRTQPTAKQVKATRKSSALVDTVIVRRDSYAPRLSVLGTVLPARDITLSPRVDGQVLEVSDSFLPGGMVRQGDLLMRIDPADFENQLSIRVSELEQAVASLQIEQGRQSLAEKELELLESTIDETNRELVLRGPQIASIRAEVNAAKAAVERAQLELDRATIVAPFDAQIISQSVNVGSQVSPGDELARMVGTKQYWVSAALPVRSLRWVRFPSDGPSGENTPGSDVTLRNTDGWPAGVERAGKVARMIGSVDQQTRLARVLITVDDPLGEQSDAPPLILQSLLQVEIEGQSIEDVVRLEREYVRDGDTVWVMKDDKLEIRPCQIVFRDGAHAYIGEGLENGDEVVLTTLATVADGVGLKRISDQPGASDEVGPEPSGAAI